VKQTTRVAGALVGVIAVAGIAASVVIQQSGQANLREKAEASRQQAEQIAQLSPTTSACPTRSPVRAVRRLWRRNNSGSYCGCADR